jgi:hypothetical protein
VVEFASPCDGSESCRRSVFGVWNRMTPHPNECNLYPQRRYCIRGVHVFTVGKSLAPALLLWPVFHDLVSVRFRGHDFFSPLNIRGVGDEILACDKR